MARFVIEEDAAPSGRFVIEDDSSVAPNSIAADPMKMTGAERKKWARERENFGKTATFGTQLRQNLFDPNQEYVTDSPIPAITKSFGNTLGSIVSAPKDIYNKFQSALDPSSPDNLRGRQQTLGQSLSTLGSAAVDTVQDLGAPVGLRGIEGLKESWGKAPVQSLATVGLMEPMVARGAKGAAASVAETAGRTADMASSRLMDMTLKQGTTLKGAKRQQNVQTALEGGYLPNKAGVDKLSTDVAATEKALVDGIAAGDAAQVRGTLDRAIANVESLREEAKRSADPAKYNAMIDDEIARLKSNPMQEGVEPVPTFKEFSNGKMGDYMREEGSHVAAMQRLSREYKEAQAKAGENAGAIPIGDIQKMKVEQGRAIKYQTKTGQAPDPFQASIDKARIRGMKEELEVQLFDVFPELKTTNQRLSNMYGLQDVLERAANRIEQNQGVGIALPIKSGSGAAIGGMLGGPAGAAVGGGIGAMIGIIEHPSVAPRLAKAIYNARKGKISLERARGIVDERLSGITNRLKDERGLVGKDINQKALTTTEIADQIWDALDHASADKHVALRGDDAIVKGKFRNSYNRPDGDKTTRLPGVSTYYLGFDNITKDKVVKAVEEAKKYGKNVYLLEGDSPVDIQHLANDPGERIFTDHKILYRYIDKSEKK